MKALKKKIISLVLTLTFLMSVFTPLTVFAEGSDPIIIDKLCVDFTTENAHPSAEAYELTKELRKLDGKNISNGTEDVGYCMNVYLWSYTEEGRTGTANQIESEDTDFLDPNLYYYASFHIRANNGFDFKHTGTEFDTSSLTTFINGEERSGIADGYYNEYWKLIKLYIPIEIDTSSKVYSVEITNSDVNVEKGDTIQFQSKTVSYGDGYDAVTWSLEGAQKAGTTISSSGLLTVAADETADSITVKVCSEKDAEKYDTVTLNVLDKLAIDNVDVDPQSATLFAGDSKMFTATVIGTDTHEVEWQLTGNSSANTTITPNDQTCTLAVGKDETAEVLTIEVTSVKDPTKSAIASITVKQLTIIDRLLINYTTEKAVAGVTAYELTKELRMLAGKNISNGTENVAYCMNVYFRSYTEPNRGGTTKQIESEDTDLLDRDLYYYVNFEIRAKDGFDFKHDGTSFDTTSLTTVVNDEEMSGIADGSYNEYWKVIDLFIPVEIKCNHNDTTTSIENLTSATMSDDGQYEEVVKCEICKEEVSRTTVIIPKVSSVELSSTDYTYDGKEKTPSVTVKDSKGTELKKDTDYTVTYASGRKDAGTYKVTVTLKGNYSGTKTVSFKINPISASKCSFKLSTTTYTYNGKVKTPSVTVKDSNGTKLTKNTHYTVKYASGRKYVGKYKVTVTMKGNYSGTKTLYLTVNPPKTSVSKLSAAKKSLKVTIKKKSSQVTGYQIAYSTSKSFKSKYTKSKTVKSYKTTSTTLKNLKAKKTYYVRVRTYKTIKGKKYYSGWSSYKLKKTK